MRFERRFLGQAAIVTGGASGIGLGIAKRMARESGSVVLADINEEALAQAKETMGELAGRVETIRIDITREDEVESLIGSIVEQFGQLDVVVNCAGVPQTQPHPDDSQPNFSVAPHLRLPFPHR
ncbi:MAG: SDR family NAD(P)-dependent oxidoreductase [Chloroflexi bacterium]|nr:SDR family NAD(P)-dependent oxidoreductase [Chloroflexota bacterium]